MPVQILKIRTLTQTQTQIVLGTGTLYFYQLTFSSIPEITNLLTNEFIYKRETTHTKISHIHSFYFFIWVTYTPQAIASSSTMMAKGFSPPPPDLTSVAFLPDVLLALGSTCHVVVIIWVFSVRVWARYRIMAGASVSVKMSWARLRVR
jgi:hypothetical protein